MTFTDTIERVAVTDSATILADRTRYMSGEVECILYEIDEAWDFKKESLEEFCRRNVNAGGSETVSEKDIDKRFEEAARGCELERYEKVDYIDVYTEYDGQGESYIVNNVSRDGKLFLPKGCTDDDLLDGMKASGIFKKECESSLFVVTGDDMLVEIEQEDGYPLCRLEKEDTTICHRKEKERKSPRR